MSEMVCRDIDELPICDGDEVWAFPARYESTHVAESGGIPIYEEHHDKPLPIADTPCFKGIVYWSEDMLAWWVRLSWYDPSWETKPCAVAMGGGSYLYQLAPK